VRSSPGRQRFNVLAALNAISYELVMVTNDTYINAGSIGELLRKIVALNLNVPITVILDNAKYQKCQIVWALAKSLHIELLYLPTYSPNLNLIERLWKFVKKQCLYSIYYPTFLDFKNAISTCLSQTTTIHKTALSSLLTLNFQTFTNVDIIQR
jgi:transposase